MLWLFLKIARAQFPLKLTDGMAMAKPVLSTRVGDILEILSDTGYIVDQKEKGTSPQGALWKKKKCPIKTRCAGTCGDSTTQAPAPQGGEGKSQKSNVKIKN